MILFDTTLFKEPELTKFEGRKDCLNPSRDGTFKSFNKAKAVVVKSIEEKLRDLNEQLEVVKSIKSADDLEFVHNPYNNYLRSKHGELD